MIGRLAQRDVYRPLPHKTVSRSHLAIEWDARLGVHTVRDMGSHNGTRLNGATLGTRLQVVNNDILQVGDVLLVYERGRKLESEDSQEVSQENIPGKSAAIRDMRGQVERAAKDPSPVLLLGETGTGKEWIAREIHSLSKRSGKLIPVNCAALGAQLIESQLFGHVRGAFTGATSDHEGYFMAANGGTLFLDEIGEMPLELQPKLLRVLQEGQIQPVGSTKIHEVDVRIIAATNQDLESQVEANKFRRDLFARLALWQINVPPIRERRLDILSWFGHLCSLWFKKRETTNPGAIGTLEPNCAEALLLAPWKDNLRGIDRLVHSLASRDLKEISLDDLPEWLFESTKKETVSPDISSTKKSKPPVPSKSEFIAVFEQLEGNVSALAKHYARDRRQIYRWIETHGLKR